jgi:signal transduction histidine kinase/DNA-binding response OmpR family regulator
MKKFYAIFFALPVLVGILLYLSIWWFIAGLAALMLFIAYRLYMVRLTASEARTVVLETELDELHVRLEKAVVKEQKTSKEADQVKKLKQQLLTVISHEVRTPMNGIMGMTLLLADTPLTKEQQEYINTIRSCGEGLLTSVNNMLVNDILDFSKLQQQGKQLEYKDFELRDSVEEVLDMFAEKTGKAGVDLVYDIAADVPEQIIGDSRRIRQVLMNLVENAVKFTRHGEIFIGITYTLHTSTGHPPELKFEVRDTGTGIPREQLKLLFKGIPGKEFKREVEKETGLGLVICKKLVELMGGTIEVTSQEGQGTSFTFSIPLTPSLKTTRAHARKNEMHHLEGKHILVVDDNATNRTTLIKQMKTWKMIPIPADSGRQALDILSQNRFDLVLADITMPGMDGIALTQSIKTTQPNLPVIGMSFTGDETYKPEAALFSSVITKPNRQSVLRDKILDIFTTTTMENQTTTTPLSDVFAEKFPLRILIAEDNPINQKIATKILTKLGYQPTLANNGKEVMEMVDQENYDIILMDVQMPEMDGLEATRLIRTCLEIQPVIIAVTANAMQGDRDECMQAGMDDYISKPIELKELLDRLEKWALALREKRA